MEGNDGEQAWAHWEQQQSQSDECDTSDTINQFSAFSHFKAAQPIVHTPSPPVDDPNPPLMSPDPQMTESPFFSKLAPPKSRNEIRQILPPSEEGGGGGGASGIPQPVAQRSTRINLPKVLELGSSSQLLVSPTMFTPASSLRSSTRYHYTDEISELFDVVGVIGSGGFGVVKKGIEKATGMEYALKFLEKSRYLRNKKQIDTEVDVLATVSHKGLVRLVKAVRTSEHLVLVTELAKGGELFERIVKLKKFSENVVRSVMQQMFSAVNALHLRGIVHRDLKPENVLMVSNDPNDFTIKITDFGLAEFADGQMLGPVGTPEYSAPEVLQWMKYDNKCDSWSLGVMMYVMLAGHLPFMGDRNQLISILKEQEVQFPEEDWVHISASAKDLISRLLTKEPTQRLSVRAALNHMWVKGIDTDDAISLDNFRTYMAVRKLRTAVFSIIASARFTPLLLHNVPLHPTRTNTAPVLQAHIHTPRGVLKPLKDAAETGRANKQNLAAKRHSTSQLPTRPRAGSNQPAKPKSNLAAAIKTAVRPLVSSKPKANVSNAKSASAVSVVPTRTRALSTGRL